jgi:hypothetical protein
LRDFATGVIDIGMPEPLERSSVEAYLFAGIGIIALVIPMNWILRTVLVLALAAIIVDLVLRSRLTVAWPKRAKVFSISVGLVLLVGASWRQIVDDYRGPEKPDISLFFVNPTDPDLVLRNETGIVGRDILWQVVLFDEDEKPIVLDQKPVIQPLSIPATKAEFLRPHLTSGPINLFDLPAVASHVTKGDRICGSAVVSCPDCPRGHSYIVYIEFGRTGWYFDIENYKDAQLYIPMNGTQSAVIGYCEGIRKKVSVSERLPIKDYVYQSGDLP